ncbi:MAG: cytochrome b/b6 domain-containing protein, partial [Hyphomicrobiales bacterium]|nr:cytochrome b/b6 domain-containing protein [Hyphomicrobiales bacterium]
FSGGEHGRTVLGLHRLAANLMWAYVIGHASVAVLHQALGDDIFSRMFWPRRRKTVSAE